MNVIPNGSKISADGLLGRDELWGRSITNGMDKTISFFANGKEIAKLPLRSAKAKRKICVAESVTIQARTSKIIPIDMDAEAGDIVVHKKEILPGVNVGNVITRIKEEKEMYQC